LLQERLKNNNFKAVCKGVVNFQLKGGKTRFDLTWGSYNRVEDRGTGVDKLRQKHLIDFKMYFKREDVTFEDVIDVLKDTSQIGYKVSDSVEKNDNQLVYENRGTGWKVIYDIVERRMAGNFSDPSVVELKTIVNLKFDEDYKKTKVAPLTDDTLLVKSLLCNRHSEGVVEPFAPIRGGYKNELSRDKGIKSISNTRKKTLKSICLLTK
jgi:hypothetical protein